MSTGLKGNDLTSVLETDTMMNSIDMLKKRGGTPKQSSLAEVGGAGGFGGVVNNIPQNILEELKRLSEVVRKISGDMPEASHDDTFNQNGTGFGNSKG